MAIGKASDFVIYQEQLHGGIVETLTQASDYFNSAGNAISLSTISRRGNFYQESFLSNTASLVTRRDTTSVSAATDIALLMNEIISVKVNRKVGPVGQTIDAFRKVQETFESPEELSFYMGEQIAKAMQVDMLNGALRSGVAALNNQSTVKHTVAANGTITTADLVSGLSKFGDAAQNISAWVMHSKVFFDLYKDQITPSTAGDNVAQLTLVNAGPASLNRPVIVTDSAALLAASSGGSYTTYYTLGLTPQGLVVENSEEQQIVGDTVTGLENLVYRVQGEFAYNLGVKGFKWDTGNGGANPTDAALGTGSNWDIAAADKKSYAGIIIQSR